ncbi:beta-ketoacyl-[acyl-carrier-protein] synthase family protein [Vibrio rumoiensis]|uniref:Beta-ketoacyl-[acyl-carrier-protein] synthase II n=1 Tax=Vibrio rumoiensis 1S-45 TaxID=1188252 RepID=A0A1E5E1Z8_9VIBR|nr:beta-ketoacyl-[acyl-carrier-protein] synthase family protein [Vibrio rumoiensis]OEF25444.1 beta-ketoacyl-[acyl-carrier-protein] synthase II [Vibrio rumoiensis 1S-45]
MSNRQHPPLYVHACGSHSALGASHTEIHQHLQQGSSPYMQISSDWLNDGSDTVVGIAAGKLPEIDQRFIHQNTRNNRLALSALLQMQNEVNQAIQHYGADRIAVLVGTSTSGIADGEHAIQTWQTEGELPKSFDYHQQEMANTSRFIADFFGITGPNYTISTACSSSGRVYLSAQRLLKAGLVDAVIVGGADTLCKLTLNGFYGLEALSHQLCNPFSDNRNGINIGEAAAFMLLSYQKPQEQHNCVALLGVGDSSDAHHISAPHPEGKGAEQAMRKALDSAGLTPQDIGYINAHGTATRLNDEMEAKAIERVFGQSIPVSSTKPLTGHTLGAASAIEAAICWHILQHHLPVPFQVNDGKCDKFSIALAKPNTQLTQPAILSNSFAFGGNNISLIFGYPND